MSERTIFLTALDKEEPTDRAAYLEEACAGDPALRQRVEALLRSHAEAGNFLQQSALSRAFPELGGKLGTAGAPTGDDENGGASAAVDLPGHLGRLGCYEVINVIGRGSMGVVLKALDSSLQRIVAIKVLAPHLAGCAASRKRFVREAQAAAAVNHENVVAIYAVDETGLVPYLVMQYIGGVSLQERLKQGPPLELKEVLSIGMQIAAGLAAAHAQGLVHRDIKPANILLEDLSPLPPRIEGAPSPKVPGEGGAAGPLTPPNRFGQGDGGRGEGVRVKITDFGLARAVDATRMTGSGIISGTPAYMSPEQARGENVDHRADLFSLGSVLYKMCTGEPPFQAGNALAVLKRVTEDAPRPIRDLNPSIPDWLVSLIARLHAKNPDDRFQSAGEAAELLRQRLAYLNHPDAVPPPAAIDPAPRRQRRPEAVRRSKYGFLVYLSPLMILAVLATAFFLQCQPFNHPPANNNPSIALPRPSLEFHRDQITPACLALAGGGDPAQAPAELTAVLGDGRLRHPGAAAAVFFIARGEKLLTIDRRNRGRIWDAKSGSLQGTFPLPAVELTGPERQEYGPVWPISAAALSPDGKTLALGAGDGRPDSLCGPGVVKVVDAATGKELHTLKAPGRATLAVAFSPDGKTLATSSAGDANVRLWDVETGKERVRLGPGLHEVCTLAFSPDGKTLATGCTATGPRLWDVATGKESAALEFLPGAGTLVFTADGKSLAAGGRDGTVRLVSVGGKQATVLGGRTQAIRCLASAPDGKFLAAGSDDGVVKLWDAAGGRERTLAAGGAPVLSLTFSPDGATLASSSSDGAIKVFDVSAGEERFPNKGHTGAVYAAAFSPNGRSLASAGADRTVRLWDLVGGKSIVLDLHAGEVYSLVFSPDGKFLASGSSDATIILWDAATGREVRTLAGHSHLPSLLAFSPDGQTVAAGEANGGVNLWDVPLGPELDRARSGISKPKVTLRWHSGVVRAAAFSPDGRFLASAGNDGTVQLGDPATGRRLHAFRAGAPVRNVAFRPDGRTLAAVTAGPDNALHLWDLASRQEVILRDHTDSLAALAFHPAGRFAATGGRDGTIRVWECGAGGGRVLTLGPGPFGNIVHQTAFAPDGRHLAAASDNGTIAILRLSLPPVDCTPGLPEALPTPLELARRSAPADALRRKAVPPGLLARAGDGNPEKAPPELVAVLVEKGMHKPILCVAVSPDGKTAAGAAEDGLVGLWDLAAGKRLRLLNGCPGPGQCLAFSRDGKWIAAGGVESIKVWEVATGKEGPTIRAAARVRSLAFSPDGKLLASGEWSGALRLWDVAAGRCVRGLVGHNGPVEAIAFSRDGQTLASRGADQTLRLWCVVTGWETARTPRQPDGGALDSPSVKALELWDRALRREKQVLRGQERPLASIAWRGDGRLLASAEMRDGAVRLWDASTAPPRSEVIPLFGRNRVFVHGLVFTPEGRHLVTANSDGSICILRLARPGEVLRLSGEPAP